MASVDPQVRGRIYIVAGLCHNIIGSGGKVDLGVDRWKETPNSCLGDCEIIRIHVSYFTPSLPHSRSPGFQTTRDESYLFKLSKKSSRSSRLSSLVAVTD
jgi:hypothetical protein